MQTLFDNTAKNLDGPAKYAEDTYTYYNNSSRVEINEIRKLLESWFALYPENEKSELKSRFKAAFEPTFYELYIFVLFIKLGYQLEIHPEIEGQTKRPDYLARKNNYFFYIEVKHMTMLSQNEQSLERRKNVLLDALNKVDASDFLLALKEISFKDNSQPSGNTIIKFFNEKIAAFNYEDYTEQLLKHGFRNMPVIVYDDDKVTIKIQLVPVSPLHRGESSRAIGCHPSVTQVGNDSGNIISSLESKATRYGNFNAPYIICLNKQSVSLDIIELQEALYGDWQISWSDNPNNHDEKHEFSGNGFFGAKHNPKFTRVSGVYLTNVNIANLRTTAGHAFRHNLFAKFPIDFVIDRPVNEILDIPPNYLKNI